MTAPMHLVDPAATEALGVALACARPAHGVIHLVGDLGAGKSTLARALLRALGVTGTIRSPTYTLVERYPLEAGGEAWHLDLYRIADAGELEYLGLDSDDTVLWLIEWPERGAGGTPAPDLVVRLAIEGDGRAVELDVASPTGAAWVARLEADHGVAAGF